MGFKHTGQLAESRLSGLSVDLMFEVAVEKTLYLHQCWLLMPLLGFHPSEVECSGHRLSRTRVTSTP